MEDGGRKENTTLVFLRHLPSSIFHLRIPLLRALRVLRGSLLQSIDLNFLLSDQRIKLRNFHRIIALLFLTEAENVCLILRPPAVEIEAILFDAEFADFLRV